MVISERPPATDCKKALTIRARHGPSFFVGSFRTLAPLLQL